MTDDKLKEIKARCASPYYGMSDAELEQIIHGDIRDLIKDIRNKNKALHEIKESLPKIKGMERLFKLINEALK